MTLGTLRRLVADSLGQLSEGVGTKVPGSDLGDTGDENEYAVCRASSLFVNIAISIVQDTGTRNRLYPSSLTGNFEDGSLPLSPYELSQRKEEE